MCFRFLEQKLKPEASASSVAGHLIEKAVGVCSNSSTQTAFQVVGTPNKPMYNFFYFVMWFEPLFI